MNSLNERELKAFASVLWHLEESAGSKLGESPEIIDLPIVIARPSGRRRRSGPGRFQSRPIRAEAGAYGINKTLVKFMNKRPQRLLPADGPPAGTRTAKRSCR